ncbi:MAG: PhoX family phosphatase [Myxococcota bacterium]|nr:PhoX family phosphatase [Myxococcota bacterium]
MRSESPSLKTLIHRRQLLKGLASTAGLSLFPARLRASGAGMPLRFKPVSTESTEPFVLPEGYRFTRVASWGDRFHDGGALAVPIESEQAQRAAFGYNCDFLAWHPQTSREGRRQGFLSVNHEYSCPELMFPGYTGAKGSGLSRAQLHVEMASLGHSVLPLKRVEGAWRVRWGHSTLRRLSVLGPQIELTGPAAGHVRLQTSADPSGRRIIGTFANCAGGKTPWGTTLIAEENFNQAFFGAETASLDQDELTRESWARFQIGEKKRRYSWHKVDPRFDLRREPHEANRFGWVVELDPSDPTRPPVKRSALGRFKHECAEVTLAPDGRVVVYSGDDQAGEFLYRFVSEQPYDPARPATGWGLLDKGTLSVACFEVDGSFEWRPLRHGEGPLTREAGFDDQGHVLIEARRAATLLGATPLDRPEDVAVDPKSGALYVMLTGDKGRAKTSAVCPRAPNPDGHILRLSPSRGDGSAAGGEWSIFYLAGGESVGGLRCPDNGAFDPTGRLWITSDVDGDFRNGLWACELDGPHAGEPRRFCALPTSAEGSGPCFDETGETLFLSAQHPGEHSRWGALTSGWPGHGGPAPRPSVVAIERVDGGLIGS